MSADPKFLMPACWRHFHTGHRWWCRACDRETESQFREVCEVLWVVQTAAREVTSAALDPTGLGSVEELPDRVKAMKDRADRIEAAAWAVAAWWEQCDDEMPVFDALRRALEEP